MIWLLIPIAWLMGESRAYRKINKLLDQHVGWVIGKR